MTYLTLSTGSDYWDASCKNCAKLQSFWIRFKVERGWCKYAGEGIDHISET